MKRSQRRELHKILETQSYSRESGKMRRLMRDLLESAGMRVTIRDGCIFAVKGNQDDPVPIFVAHLDTVHKHIGEHYKVVAEPDGADFIYWAYNSSTGMRTGVGGDDKCGLWVALQASKHFANCRVVLLRDEEIGGLGARSSPKGWYNGASVVIEADRRGNGDAVTEASGIRLSSDEWQDHVSDIVSMHGYAWEDAGGFTDVTELCESHKITTSAINISAGYHRPHTDYEYVSDSDLENALDLTISLADKSAGRTWDVRKEDRVSEYWGAASWRSTKWTKKSWALYGDKFELKTDDSTKYDPDPVADAGAWGKVTQAWDDGPAQFVQGIKCPTCGNDGMMYDRDQDMVMCVECEEYTSSSNALQ